MGDFLRESLAHAVPISRRNGFYNLERIGTFLRIVQVSNVRAPNLAGFDDPEEAIWAGVM